MKHTPGQRLMLLRQERNLTRTQAAAAVGCTESAMSNYENDKRLPTDRLKINIAAFYGKTVQELFFD